MKLLVAYIIFAVASIGFLSYANAETQDTVIVPFDFNGKVCGLIENGNFVCEYDPNRINLKDAMENGTDIIPDVLTGSTTTCPDRFDIQEDGVTCLPKECKDGYHFTSDYYCEKDAVEPEIIHDRVIAPFERQLEQYEQNPPKTWNELDEKWKLEHLIKCWYGLDSTRGIQTEKSFVTSSWSEESSVPKATDISVIDRAIAQCNAQTVMLEILGHGRNDDTVRSPQGWWGMVEPSHTERAKDVPTWSQDRVNIESNIGIDNTVKYCDAVQHLSLQTKEFMGCNPPKAYVNTDQVIEYGSIAEDRMNQYLLDGGESMAEEIKANIFAEQRAQLYSNALSSNDNQRSTVDQIREIESQGWNLYPDSSRPSICNDWNEFTKSYPHESRLQYLEKCGE